MSHPKMSRNETYKNKGTIHKTWKSSTNGSERATSLESKETRGPKYKITVELGDLSNTVIFFPTVQVSPSWMVSTVNQ